MTRMRINIRSVLAASFLVLLGMSQSASASLLRYYSFDTNYNDSSGNNQHGVPLDGNANSSTAGVSITTTPGEWKFGGGAANFTEERDWVSIPSFTFGSGSPYSISFWARDLAPASNTGGMVIGQADSNNFFIWLDTSAGGLRWRSSDSSANRVANFTFTRDDDWHHYVVIAGDFEDANTTVDEIRLYRDGGLVGTAAGKLTGLTINAIGEAYTTSLNADFLGQIDEVRIFDEAISAEVVGNLYQFNSVVPEPSAFVLCAIGGATLILRRAQRRTTR